MLPITLPGNGWLSEQESNPRLWINSPAMLPLHHLTTLVRAVGIEPTASSFQARDATDTPRPDVAESEGVEPPTPEGASR